MTLNEKYVIISKSLDDKWHLVTPQAYTDISRARLAAAWMQETYGIEHRVIHENYLDCLEILSEEKDGESTSAT